MSAGAPGHALWPGLDVQSGDETVHKYRFSCDSSARDAMMTDFGVVMVSDGNAAMDQAEHDVSLAALYLIVTDLMDTNMLVARLSRPVAAAA